MLTEEMVVRKITNCRSAPRRGLQPTAQWGSEQMRFARFTVLTALPALVLGYAVLTAALLRRIKPLPITLIPERVGERSDERAEALVA